MNKFIINRSRLFILVTWAFALAFINDAANLTDIFPDTSTYHFDEGDGSEAINQSLSSDLGVHALSNPSWHFAQKSLKCAKTGMVRHVVLDEDSPSLAAIRIVFSNPYFLYPQEETPAIHSV